MSKDKRAPGRLTNIILIYRMMFTYWHYMLSGFVAMLLFALFSGASVTLVIPLFDYVFNPNKVNLLYHNLPDFLGALGHLVGNFISGSGGFWAATHNYSQFWTQLQALMLNTDSLVLLYTLCVVIFVIILLKNGFFFLQKVLFTQLRGRTIRDVRNYMFSRYLNQSLEFFSHNRIGDAIVRMINDVDIVSDQLISSMFDALREAATLIVFARIAFLLNPKLFLYSIFVLPLFSLTISFLGKKIKKYSQRIQEQLSILFSTVEEVLNSIKIVQAFRKETSEINNFCEINNRHFHLWSRSQNYGALNPPVAEINSVITGVVVILIGGGMILKPGSNFSLGDFTAFLFALFSMLHPLKVITQVYTDIKKALVSLDRIALVLNHSSDIVDKPDAVNKTTFDKELRFEQVGFYYKPGKPVLQGFDLTISKGMKIAFVGSSGGGKTTLANLLNRLYEVKEGRITMDGIDIRDIKLDDYRQLFGVVTQDSVLFTKTISANIAYGSNAAVSAEQVQQAAIVANADEFIQQLSHKYDEKLGNKANDLSGGQRQRLCIARAVVSDPPILILDEATSALDTDSERKVQDAINEATRNRTVIIIAHRLSSVINADAIVVLEKGRIVGYGTHEELLQTCARYQYLYRMQSDQQN